MTTPHTNTDATPDPNSDANTAPRDEPSGHPLVVAETNRLLLRRINIDDFDFFAALFADAKVMQFSLGVRTHEQTREWIERATIAYEAHEYGPWCILRKSDGVAIGSCGLLDQTVDGTPEAEIGYRLAEPFWGQGFAPEAAAAVRDLAFGRFNLPRVIALIDPNNVRSIRVAEKIGMDWSTQTLKWHRRLRVYSIEANRDGNANPD